MISWPWIAWVRTDFIRTHELHVLDETPEHLQFEHRVADHLCLDLPRGRIVQDHLDLIEIHRDRHGVVLVMLLDHLLLEIDPERILVEDPLHVEFVQHPLQLHEHVIHRIHTILQQFDSILLDHLHPQRQSNDDEREGWSEQKDDHHGD